MKDPFGLAVGEIFHGQFDDFPTPVQGIFRGKFQMPGMGEFGLG